MKLASWKIGQTIDVEATTQEITLAVIIRAVFGVEAPERIKSFITAIENFSSSYTQSLFMFPFLRKCFFGVGPWDKFIAARANFDALLDEEIQQRRNQDTSQREDILSLMLDVRYDDGNELDGEDLRDELRTLLVAGHETTATALAWALTFLSYKSNIRDKLRMEIGSLGDCPHPETLVKQPYLEATCKEALRLHPVVPIVLRRVVKPFSLRNHSIPVGKSVGVAISILHHHDDIWEQPSQFNPERFVGYKYSPFEFAPFGGGTRRCVGAAFAMYEMQVILGTLMSKAVFSEIRTEPVPPKMRSITSGFREPVFVEYLGCPTHIPPD